MEKYGYIRVSTNEQNLDRQYEALTCYGVKRGHIYADYTSGKDFNRPAYQKLLHSLQPGDVLVIKSIDRLGRNYAEIKKQWDYITNTLKANIKVLDMPLLDTSISSKENLDGRFIADLVLQILSYVAEKERENTKNRQAQGYAVMPVVNGKKVSLKTGKSVGRPNAEYPESWETVYNTWKSGEITAITAMKQLELTKTTFYKLVKLYEKKA